MSIFKFFILIYFCLHANLGLGSSTPKVLVFNSLPNHQSLFFGKFNNYIEKQFNEYLEGTGFSPIYIHQATQEELYRHIKKERHSYAFWIGHGNNAYEDAVNSTIITDAKERNIVSIFRDLHHSFDFLSIVTCNSKEIFQDVQQMEDSVLFKGKIKFHKALKRSLSEFQNKYQITRECRPRRRIGPMSERLHQMSCRNSQAQNITVKKAQKVKEVPTATGTVSLASTAHSPRSVQVFLNKKLVDIVELENGYGTFNLPLNDLSPERSELVISTGYLGKTSQNYSLDELSLSLEISDYQIQRFSLGEIKTFNGNALFYIQP